MSEWCETTTAKLIADGVLKIGDGYRAKNSELTTDGLPFARAGNINNGFQFSGADRLPSRYVDVVGDKVSEPGDTVFTSKGTVGRFGFVTERTERFIYSPQLCFWRSLNHEEVFPRFIYYWMHGHEFLGQVEGLKGQTDMADYVNLADQRRMSITVPPLPEQKSIAAVLSSLDDKIDLLHRQNKTLEAMAETLFRQWFLEEAGEDWEEVELGSVVDTTSGGTPSRSKMEFYENGSINWVKSKELSGSFVLDTEEKITLDALKNSSAKLLPANSILIAMYGATVGEYAIISKEMSCNQAVCALMPSEKYPYTFLFLYVKTYKNELINMAVGSAQQNISQLLIKQLPIPTCHEKIADFHTKTEPFFEKINSNIQQTRTLEKLRDTLLPKLMSGEVRVQLDEGEAA